MRSKVLVGVVFVALAVGCTPGPGDPSPTTTAPVTAPPTATASHTSSQPAPTSGSPQGEAQALQAVTDFYREFNAALVSLNTTNFRATFTQGCRVCKQDAATIDSDAAAGRRYEGGGAALAGLRTTSQPDEKRFLARAEVSTIAMEVRDASGKVVANYPASSAVRDFIVYLTEAGWRVEGVAA